MSEYFICNDLVIENSHCFDRNPNWTLLKVTKLNLHSNGISESRNFVTLFLLFRDEDDYSQTRKHFQLFSENTLYPIIGNVLAIYSVPIHEQKVTVHCQP